MDNTDIKILLEISGDMALDSQPFKGVAEAVGISEDEVLHRIKNLVDKGIVKRIAPILYHQKTTFTKNALTIWAIEEARVKEIAEFFADYTHISHVYERATDAEWPYNLYGMIHAKSTQEIDAILEEILERTGPVPHKVVYTVREWKKTSPNLEYLLDEKM